MRRSLAWVLILLACGLAALGCKTVPVADECPETASQPCLSERRCAWDEKRGCQRCVCEGVWESDPYREERRARGEEE
ncbi:MAG TPA: hypothetical protein PK668_15960 [Myxococcota bacterium]|nr:hypothetical protein [Myxococcota bacterium]HRY94392.1 hypothetical protein [Myxococcota bacterium]HSA19994.1 hypothetical protein [Myxococcota bacterium]